MYHPNQDAVRKTERHSPAVSTAAVVTLEALANESHVLDIINFSYNATPSAAANIKVEVGGVLRVEQFVPDAGPHQMFLGGYSCGQNAEVVITLAADAGFIGRLDVFYR